MRSYLRGLSWSRRPEMFRSGYFKLHSGGHSSFKIDCDGLTDDELAAIAVELYVRLPAFRSVEGIPRGGLRLAQALTKWVVPGNFPALIVDDVLTTGKSMEQYRSAFRGEGGTSNVIGAVIFARVSPPSWIRPLFLLC